MKIDVITYKDELQQDYWAEGTFVGDYRAWTLKLWGRMWVQIIAVPIKYTICNIILENMAEEVGYSTLLF